MLRVRRSHKYFWILLIAGIVFIILYNVKDSKSLSYFEMKERVATNNLTLYKHIEAAEKLKKCPNHLIPSEIHIENDYWQVFKSSNVTFKMFNAYYDERDFYARQSQSVIKIIAFIDQVSPSVKTFCQLWFEGFSAPIVSEVYEYKLMWHELWGVNKIGSQPYLVACLNPLVNLGLIPSAVSLVGHDCDAASNYLKVIYNPPEIRKVKPVAVCVKLYDFMEDQTATIVEWIEIMLLLGVDKIFVNVIEVHPNIMKALEFYEIAGKVKVDMMSMPKGLPNNTRSKTQWLQNDLIAYNDCLYKHMYEYNFLVPLDTDEIILPTGPDYKTWIDLLSLVIQAGRVKKDELYSGYAARNVFFLLDNNHEGKAQPDIPSNLIFLQHVYRAVNFSSQYIGAKSFQNTRNVAVMHNHFPMHCLGKDVCDYFFIPTELGQLQHYRRGCENYPAAECEDFKKNTVKDLTLWKFKDEILENVNKTLRSLV